MEESHHHDDPLSKSHDPLQRIMVNVLDPLKCFYGRQTFLNHLHTTLQKDRLAIVSGPKNGGVPHIGKTESIRMYVAKYRENFYQNVIWLPSHTQQSLESSFNNFASKCLHIETKGKKNIDGEKTASFESVVDQVYQIIMSGRLGSTLIIFEDVTDYKIIQYFVSPSLLLECEDYCPFLLILKKSQDDHDHNHDHDDLNNQNKNENNCYWPQNSFTILHLDVFGLEEAINFVLNFLDLPDSEINQKEATELCKHFGQIPLALQLAVAFIHQKNFRETKTPFKISKHFSIKEYLKMCQFSRKSANNYEKNLRTALNLNLQKILTNSTGYYGAKYPKIVDTLARLHGDSMDVRMLHALLDPQLDHSVVDKCFKILENFAIIHVRKNCDQTDSISMHPFVQKMILEKFSKPNEQKMDDIVEDLVTKFDPIFQKFSQFSNSLQQNIFQNSLHLINHIDGLSSSSASAVPSKNQILFKVTLASKLKHASNFLPALRLYQEIYEFMKSQRGPDHVLTTGAKIQIANLLHTKGDLGQALELYLQIYDAQQQQGGYNGGEKGQQQQQILDTMKNIGNIYQDLGQWDEAVEVYEEILQMQKNYSHHHPDGVAFLGKLATLKEKQGKVHEALGFYGEAFDISNKILGSSHPTTRTVNENLSRLKLNVDCMECRVNVN